MLERDFQKQVTDLAEIYGWQYAHFRPAVTTKGWRTPVSGSLGAGWVDLVLCHPKSGRVLLAELKSDKGKLSPHQSEVIETQRTCGLTVHVWRPSDLDWIAQELR